MKSGQSVTSIIHKSAKSMSTGQVPLKKLTGRTGIFCTISPVGFPTGIGESTYPVLGSILHMSYPRLVRAAHHRLGDAKYPRVSILEYVCAPVGFVWHCTGIEFHPCQNAKAHVILATIHVGSLLIGRIPVATGMLFINTRQTLVPTSSKFYLVPSAQDL